jgi:hypothetical protein
VIGTTETLLKVVQIVDSRTHNPVDSFLGKESLVRSEHDIVVAQQSDEIGILHLSTRPILKEVRRLVLADIHVVIREKETI